MSPDSDHAESGLAPEEYTVPAEAPAKKGKAKKAEPKVEEVEAPEVEPE